MNSQRTSFVLLVCLAVCVFGHTGNVFAIEGEDFISTSNYANKSLKYYYYIPPKVIDNKNRIHPILAMIPGLSADGRSFVGPGIRRFAEKEGFIIIAPTFIFDEKNWQSKTSYQYPHVWSGEAFLRMVRKIEGNHKLRINKIYLFGHSAGAQFALRFALWRPSRCAACAAHASGGRITPERYIGVRFFVTVGTQDTTRIENAKEFHNSAKRYRIDATYREYNTGHGMTHKQFEDSLDFFMQGRARYPDSQTSPEPRAVANNVIVHLKNGRSMPARIVKESEKKIVLEIGDYYSAGTITILRRNIESIEKVD